jgi:hypothetical protein
VGAPREIITSPFDSSANWRRGWNSSFWRSIKKKGNTIWSGPSTCARTSWCLVELVDRRRDGNIWIWSKTRNVIREKAKKRSNFHRTRPHAAALLFAGSRQSRSFGKSFGENHWFGIEKELCFQVSESSQLLVS